LRGPRRQHGNARHVRNMRRRGSALLLGRRPDRVHGGARVPSAGVHRGGGRSVRRLGGSIVAARSSPLHCTACWDAHCGEWQWLEPRSTHASCQPSSARPSEPTIELLRVPCHRWSKPMAYTVTGRVTWDRVKNPRAHRGTTGSRHTRPRSQAPDARSIRVGKRCGRTEAIRRVDADALRAGDGNQRPHSPQLGTRATQSGRACACPTENCGPTSQDPPRESANGGLIPQPNRSSYCSPWRAGHWRASRGDSAPLSTRSHIARLELPRSLVCWGGVMRVFLMLVVTAVVAVGADGRAVSRVGAEEKRGCCSHHQGVCGCEGQNVKCCDGTLSPTCMCGE